MYMTFREIEISDKQLFESKVNEDMFCENCCGYERVFQVLYCFSKQYNYKMAIDNGTIYVMFNHEGNIGFFPPIVKHPHEFLPAFEKLVKYCEKSDIQLKIYGIDKVKIDIIASARKYMFYASSDRNTFEYLYRPEKLINMGDYSLQKRNMLKSFEKRFKSELREYQEEDRAEVIGLLKEWSETKGQSQNIGIDKHLIEYSTIGQGQCNRQRDQRGNSTSIFLGWILQYPTKREKGNHI